jgi:hypothetical protein
MVYLTRAKSLRESQIITCGVTKVNDEETLLALLDLLAKYHSVKAR